MPTHDRKADGSVEGDYTPLESCKDSFKYRLVQEGGRFRFESVRFEGDQGCLAEDLTDMTEMVDGRYLDEVDVASLKNMKCKGNRICGCPQEVAKMVLEVRDILLTER